MISTLAPEPDSLAVPDAPPPPPQRPPVLVAENITKSFGDRSVLKGLSLDVQAGESFCIVGPNGAGKSTAVDIFLGLLAPDGGEVALLGRDPAKGRAKLFQEVGVQFQRNAFYPRVTPVEGLRAHAALYDRPQDPDRLLAALGLDRCASTRYMHLSGGERRRLHVALALMGSPRIAFLDEPSSGLDPQAQRALWEGLDGLRAEGLTLVFTTHNMREAEQNADRVGLLLNGRAALIGPPSALIRERGFPSCVEGELPDERSAADAAMQPPASALRVDRTSRHVRLYGEGADFEADGLTWLRDRGCSAVSVRATGLEDLFFLESQTP